MYYYNNNNNTYVYRYLKTNFVTLYVKLYLIVGLNFQLLDIEQLVRKLYYMYSGIYYNVKHTMDSRSYCIVDVNNTMRDVRHLSMPKCSPGQSMFWEIALFN